MFAEMHECLVIPSASLSLSLSGHQSVSSWVHTTGLLILEYPNVSRSVTILKPGPACPLCKPRTLQPGIQGLQSPTCGSPGSGGWCGRVSSTPLFPQVPFCTGSSQCPRLFCLWPFLGPCPAPRRKPGRSSVLSVTAMKLYWVISSLPRAEWPLMCHSVVPQPGQSQSLCVFPSVCTGLSWRHVSPLCSQAPVLHPLALSVQAALGRRLSLGSSGQAGEPGYRIAHSHWSA